MRGEGQTVIPVKAGTQNYKKMKPLYDAIARGWVPASAGMTTG
jgi:hypothetical protein